jgi:polyhydroxyalkanoate synthase
VVLLVPAPIKRWYVWDLQPDRSVVARCGAAGLRVFLVEWTDAGPDEQERGLEEYADTLLSTCLGVIGEQTGNPALLAGHSLGGDPCCDLRGAPPATRGRARAARITAALRLGRRRLRPARSSSPPRPLAPVLRTGGCRLLSQRGQRSRVPPWSFQLERYLDRVRSLTDPTALATHLRVERWTLDEFALPGRLYQDMVEKLYRRDEFMAGTLEVNGARVGPASLTAPMVNVLDPRSVVVPPRSILLFHSAAASRDKRVLHYRRDVGVALQHVGVLVGRGAHRELWPQLLDWMQSAWSS